MWSQSFAVWFPCGRINYNIHLDLFFRPPGSNELLLKLQWASTTIFFLHRPKNIPLLKHIYFEIVEWQKISRKITCSAAANVIRQTRSSFFPSSRPGSTCSADSLCLLLADVSVGRRTEVWLYFHVVFRHNDGKVTWLLFVCLRCAWPTSAPHPHHKRWIQFNDESEHYFPLEAADKKRRSLGPVQSFCYSKPHNSWRKFNLGRSLGKLFGL